MKGFNLFGRTVFDVLHVDWVLVGVLWATSSVVCGLTYFSDDVIAASEGFGCDDGSEGHATDAVQVDILSGEQQVVDFGAYGQI